MSGGCQSCLEVPALNTDDPRPLSRLYTWFDADVSSGCQRGGEAAGRGMGAIMKKYQTLIPRREALQGQLGGALIGPLPAIEDPRTPVR